MSESTIALLITSIITLLGWGTTYYFQRKILTQTLNNQKTERELIVFRDRLSIIREFIIENHNLSLMLSNLQALLEQKNHDIEKYTKIFTDINSYNSRMIILIFDPAFRSTQSLLPQKKAEDIISAIKKINISTLDIQKNIDKKIIDFSFTDDEIKEFSSTTENIRHEIVLLTEEVSKSYAELDLDLQKK